ncbi:hypothetical protein [Neisseria basseii]|uniref:hypothetical protein n=1 Tax=Neisseria basseii TaxID=2830650 RepID=UPI00265B0553|nr:hypothetical protein [Neisseria basseii]
MPSETIKQCFRRHQHLHGFAIFTKTASQNPVIPQKQKIKNRNPVIPAQAGI